MIRGALILGTVLLSAQATLAQVAGRVTTGDGTAINGATVEVWDAYPGGTILNSTASNSGSGEFALPAVAGDFFDLRVYKYGYFPTVVRDLPDPTTNALVMLFPVPTAVGGTTVADFWDDNSTFLSASIRAGDVIESIDPRSMACGVSQYIPALGNYLLHAKGDDPVTPETDGALAGEDLTIKVNGLAASTDVTPKFLPAPPSYQVRLTGATAAPGVTMTGELERPGKAGNIAIIPVTVTNTGDVTVNVTVTADLDQPWAFTIELAPTKSLPLTIAPGASEDVVVKIDVPIGEPDQDVEVRVHVQVDDYAPANSGVWTNLKVQAISDAGNGGNGLVPDQFALAQNYPNPFNPATSISYSLKVDGIVRLDVINLLGQNICTLVDGYRARGMHMETWDGRDRNGATVPSGIYFYRLTQNAESLTRKMVLLK
ncbi:MAG: T9SS type A sorting domain-containing protein [Candidatus Zixiibacteriota bacterium]